MMAETTFHGRRPLGVRAANGAAGLLSRCGLGRELTRRSIVRAAQRRTGRDASDESWNDGPAGEALDRLLGAMREDEETLTPLGRIVARRYLAMLVANRLRAERAFELHPEIADLPCPRPLFVTGLPRTGTTLLYNLLAQHRTARCLLTWEALWPAPVSPDATTRDDPRPGWAKRLIRALRYGSPGLQTVHPLFHDVPEECTWLLMHTFASPGFLMAGELASYEDWLLERSLAERTADYRYYRKLLQLLQWQRPGERWLLKSPAHPLSLDALVEVFPDAQVILTHRDPGRAIPSGCSMFAVTRAGFQERIDLERLGRRYAACCAQMCGRAARVRAAHPERIHDVRYDDLVADPVGTVRRLFEELGEGCDEESLGAMREWMERNPRNRFGVHKYSLEQFGLDEAAIEEMFGDYTEQFALGAAAGGTA